MFIKNRRWDTPVDGEGTFVTHAPDAHARAGGAAQDRPKSYSHAVFDLGRC